MGKATSAIVMCGLALLVPGWAEVACSGQTFIGGNCETSENCQQDGNYIGGSTCVVGNCACDPGKAACCSSGGEPPCPTPQDYKCRLAAECDSSHVDEHPTKCASPGDCPVPAEAWCAMATCEGGLCGVSMKPFGKLPSQAAGDCEDRYCDGVGNVVSVENGGDVFNDANQCSIDTCEGGMPENTRLPNGTPCPELGGDQGICYEGACVGCSAVLKIECKNGKACDGVYCVPPHCVDMALDTALGETDINCGGPCRPCFQGQKCKSYTDCLSSKCSGGVCAAPSNSDGVKNGEETGIDCGCASCVKACKDGEGCLEAAACESGVCLGGVCQMPACFDGVKNGGEVGIDCGGPCAMACPGGG